MARPVWTGVLTFGLVALPVALYTAVEDRAVRFHQLERGTSDRVRNRRVKVIRGTNVVDLMDALKRSVAQVREGRSKPEAKAPSAEQEELADLTKAELYDRATDLGVRGRSKMDRDELQEAVKSAMAA